MKDWQRCQSSVHTQSEQQNDTSVKQSAVASPIFICLIIHFRDGCSFSVMSAARSHDVLWFQDLWQHCRMIHWTA
jgi:hypothetical protein